MEKSPPVEGPVTIFTTVSIRIRITDRSHFIILAPHWREIFFDFNAVVVGLAYERRRKPEKGMGNVRRIRFCGEQVWARVNFSSRADPRVTFVTPLALFPSMPRFHAIHVRKK
jgi:hypothetical protein